MTSVASLPEEMRGLVRRYRGAFLTVVLLSAMLNLLILAGSLYMMLVYDSVLPSHSLSSLFGLFLLLLAVYAFQGAFDAMRSRILGDVAAGFDHALARRVQRAMSDASLRNGGRAGDGLAPMRDLESVRSFLAGPGPAILIDLPWMIFFIGVLMMLHVWVGVTALVGGALLVGLTLVTNRVTKEPTERLSSASAWRGQLAEKNLHHVEMLTAMGMRERMLDRWEQVNAYYLAAQASIARSVSTLGGFSKIGRMLLQSLILTVGAILVIDGKASGGVIFASSILSARALAPVDQAIANWRTLAAARLGWRRLAEVLSIPVAGAAIHTALPKPSRTLTVEQLFVAAPGTGQMVVGGADFTLNAGEGLAIVGPSAAGKSSLARALLGLWPAARGAVRLDGAALDQWRSDALGQHIGYLPQSVELMNGSVAENISRFDPLPSSDKVIAAARAAGVHDMIVALPNGYDTQVGQDGRNLSGGQQQRIALARALYGDPFLVLLDEPNSNLDAEGDSALAHAIRGIRERGGIAVLIAHRPSALANISHVLVMQGGRMQAFGPRDEILQQITARAVPSAQSRPDGQRTSEAA